MDTTTTGPVGTASDEGARAEADYDDIEYLLGRGATPIEGAGGACDFIGIRRTKLFEHSATGGIFTVKIGGKRLVPRREQVRFLRYGPRATPLVVEG